MNTAPGRQRGAVTLIGALFIIMVIALMGLVVNHMAGSNITDTGIQNDSVDALFLAESGIEFASFRYANGTACVNLAAAVGTRTAGRGEFEVTGSALAGSDCQITVEGRVSSVGASTPDTALRTVSALLRLAAGEGWAVGNGGTMLRWDGASWSAFPSNTTQTLRSVHCVTQNDCWAVGDNGVIIHWDGSNWTPTPSGTTGSLLGVSCQPLTPGHCYANGLNLFFFFLPVPNSRHWDGSNWTNGGGGFSIDLYTDVSCPSANCFSVMRGGSIHQSSTSWGTVFTGATALNGIDCAAMDQCWAVGDLSGNNYYFVRNNGGTWSFQTVAAPNQTRSNLNAVSCSAPGDCWAVGDRRNGRYVFAHWDGGNWTSVGVQNGQHRENLNGVHCLTDMDCWAVGNQRNGWNLVHYDGVSWSYIGSTAASPQNLNDVYLSSGGSGSVSLVRWQEVINN